jgi:hypothetical protein
VRAAAGAAAKLVLLIAALALVAAAPAAGDSGDGAVLFHQEATFTEPVSDVNPCTGEPFSGVATIHIVTTSVSTPNGQVSHLSDVITLQFQAVGASGTRYVGVQVSPLEVTVEDAGNGLEEVVGTGTFLVTRAGESGPTPDDFIEHEVLGAHIDLASGTTTLTFFHSFAECR